MSELAETIAKSGVYQAILARPKDNRLEIVFGASRYRASLLAGKETIPTFIREMSDAEVLEAQLVENLQRRDVHPMEEVEGYKRLLALTEPTYTIEQIAAKVGKPPVQPGLISAGLNPAVATWRSGRTLTAESVIGTRRSCASYSLFGWPRRRLHYKLNGRRRERGSPTRRVDTPAGSPLLLREIHFLPLTISVNLKS